MLYKYTRRLYMHLIRREKHILAQLECPANETGEKLAPGTWYGFGEIPSDRLTSTLYVHRRIRALESSIQNIERGAHDGQLLAAKQNQQPQPVAHLPRRQRDSRQIGHLVDFTPRRPHFPVPLSCRRQRHDSPHGFLHTHAPLRVALRVVREQRSAWVFRRDRQQG